jgi:hypothetical protein
MSTSASLHTNSIWKTAIGHDPYANAAEDEEKAKQTEADKEKIAKVKELAKTQNITDGAQRNDFTSKLYLGLKRGKQRRSDAQKLKEVVDPKLQGILEAPSSSSEDEFVEVEVKKEKKKKSSKKRSKRKRRSSSSSSEASTDESSDRYVRKRRRDKSRKKKKRSLRRRSRDSDDDSSEEDYDRRRRKEKRSREESRKSSRRDHRDIDFEKSEKA